MVRACMMSDDAIGRTRQQPGCLDPPRSDPQEPTWTARRTTNLARCNCSYEPCSRKGKCCDCIAYHLREPGAAGLRLPGRRRAHLRPHVRPLRPAGGEGQGLGLLAAPRASGAAPRGRGRRQAGAAAQQSPQCEHQKRRQDAAHPDALPEARPVRPAGAPRPAMPMTGVASVLMPATPGRKHLEHEQPEHPGQRPSPG